MGEYKIQMAGKAELGYTVWADNEIGSYLGFVRRSDLGKGKTWEAWRSGNAVTDSTDTPLTFPTRKAAIRALEPIAVAERLARIHWRNATSEDRTVSAGDSPIYLSSREALIAAIGLAYPDMDAKVVYYEWTGHGESVIQTVNSMRREREELAKVAAENAADDAQWNAWIARHDLRPATQEQYDAAIDADHAEALAEQTARVEADQMEDARDEREQAAFEAAHTTPVERDVTVDISRDEEGFAVTLVAVFPEAINADGQTRAGTPFARVRVPYADLEAARRMVDVMAAEFRNDTSKVWAGYTVTLTGLASLSSRL